MVLASGAQGVLFAEAGSDPISLFIDVGASSREEAGKKAQIGDWAVVRGVVSDMGDRLAAPYMDDRCGCAVLMETMRRLGKTDNEIVAVFTTQEEVGLRGATTAGYAAHPDVVEALEAAAAKAGVPCQREILLGGSTDAAAIHKSRAGVPSGVISLPCRYVHAPCEMVDLNDLEGAVRILLALL